MTHHIHMAPLQGLTDYPFRNAHAAHIGGVDEYFTPYLKLDPDYTSPKAWRQLAPEHNKGLVVIPQIMVNQAEHFVLLSQKIAELGYTEVNLNLGCPYPMVTKRTLGSGLLPHPEKVHEMLSGAMPKVGIKVSVKMRTGLEHHDDLLPMLEVLNQFALSRIILHPRVGKQLYKGTASREQFAVALANSKNPLVYNGDLTNSEDFEQLKTAFPLQSDWMIGRALIANPFLGQQLKGLGETDYKQSFDEFHQVLMQTYQHLLQGEGHLMQKMNGFWEYFSQSFTNSHKVYKGFKKAVRLWQWEAHYKTVMATIDWVGK